MQVQKISFTSSEPKKESALYSKKGYMDLVRASQFTEGFLAGYAVLETIDKFQLIKNNDNLAKDALKAKAWKHTKYNLLAGLATGVGSVLIGKFFTDKYTIPLNEKIADWADKQIRINEKAKELVEQEENQDKKEPLKEEPLKAEEIKSEEKSEQKSEK